MSIAYFPNLYEDELIYSVLSRFYEHVAYLTLGDMKREIFTNEKVCISKDFFKHLRPKVIALLTKDMDCLIQEHTMFPCYRFVEYERRNKAYQAIMDMEGDFSKLFGATNKRSGESRALRYCPLCTKEDRERLGETYWHCSHQIRGLHICPKHKCFLMDSDVSMDSKVYSSFETAENHVKEEKAVLCNDLKEIKLALYMQALFHLRVDLDNHENVGKFLHSKIVGTKYLSARGEKIYYHRLWDDLKRYYAEIEEADNLKDSHIQRIFMGERYVFHEICMIAMFLNIQAKELAYMVTPDISPQQQFDDEVKKLRDEGMGIKEIARKMGVSTSVIGQSIEISKRDEKKEKIVRIGRKEDVLDWDELDIRTLPLVNRAIMELHGDGTQRPQKVSFYAISKKLDILPHRLRKMEMCNIAILKNMECQEKYHARKIIYAFNMLEKEGKAIKLWRLCHIAKLEVEEVRKSLPYLEKLEPCLTAMLEKELKQVW